MESKGEYINFEDPAEDAVFGRGKIEDFTWKGYRRLHGDVPSAAAASPSARRGTPESRCLPKIVIMDLRDHLFAKAPYIFGAKPDTESPTNTEGAFSSSASMTRTTCRVGIRAGSADSPLQATRPLVGDAASLGVIDPDVLWSCTTCGACVEQCPVDIEHIDHIVDMRRYQVMMESEFPGELGGLYRTSETKGNPWGQNSKGTVDLDRRGELRRAGLRQGRRPRSPGSSTCSGSVAPAPWTTAPRRPRRRRTAGRRRGEVPRARRRRDLALVTRRGAPGTSSSSSSWLRRTSRLLNDPLRGCRARRPQGRRHPARTASTPGPGVPQVGGS